MDEAKETTEVKAFIRVFDGKMWYYTSTVDIDNIQQALDELYGYATPNPDISSGKTWRWTASGAMPFTI